MYLYERFYHLKMPLKLNKGDKVAQIWGAAQIGRSDFAKLQKPNDVNNTNKC